ncbi:hypothetical protein TNCV_2067061 [Trichonephila clavipes]|uniref:Uncharacterized protein n=1 Tax=Trichonephila clavipes TaxID=2585209 RepID=A0A8X6W2Z0_TRICX|nr:hypothetical protein TNCV_2067061 [Trichonephila clavipes]
MNILYNDYIILVLTLKVAPLKQTNIIRFPLGSDGLEVAYPLRKPKVADSIIAGVDRFPGYENRRHACHMIMWHAKDSLSIKLALVLSAKLKHGSISYLIRA